MAIDFRPQTVTREQFAAIFALERQMQYPEPERIEVCTGYALERQRLEAAAEILCCPFKAVPPNWQHGRVIYAKVRERVAALPVKTSARHVDIGTAKGFSALCALWALDAETGGTGLVDSVDVMPPNARIKRNTPAECDGLLTLYEILQPWPEAQRITFHDCGSPEYLRQGSHRIHTAFIDGKHSTAAVREEWQRLSARQEPGDLAIFDDVQMPAVQQGLKDAKSVYDFETVHLGLVNRAYAIGIRR